jgi:hypothetical protein
MWPSVCPFLGFFSEGLVMRVWRDYYNPWRFQYGHGMTFDMIFLLAYIMCKEQRMRFGWSRIDL